MFTFDLDTDDLFAERTRQFIQAWGIPASIVRQAQHRIRDAWSDDRGGWTPEWAAEAEHAEAQRDWLLAALCWGAAKFPCIATESRAEAYRRQLLAYQRAIPQFPADFQRHIRTVDGEGRTGEVAAHIIRRRTRPRGGAILLCGGVDTWKVELHRPAVRIARATGLTVVALDNPGTGESLSPLGPESDTVLSSTIDALRPLIGGGPLGMIGVSFAGLWAAKLAMRGIVDAAVTLGGPVGAEQVEDISALPNGMPGILAHATGMNQLLTAEQARQLQDKFSLGRQGYFDRAPISPILAVNGDHDQFVPASDTTVFSGMPGCEAWLARDATHCAAEKLTTVMPAALFWMVARLTHGSLDRAKARALKQLASYSLVKEACPFPAKP